MEVIYILTKDDILGFQRFHMGRKGKPRWLASAGNVVFVILWVLQLWLVVRLVIQWRFVLTLGPRVWWVFVEMHQHILVSFLILSLYLTYLLWGQKLLRSRQAPDTRVLSLPKRMQIGPRGVEVVTERERVQRPWSAIRDIDSDNERLYLYTTPTTALIVPKRAFDSEETAQAFEAQARACRLDPYGNVSLIANPTDSAVWPPPPQPKAFAEPAPKPDDAPGSLQVQYVTRKADLWRSQLYFLSRRPSALLSIFIPYMFAAGIWSFGRLPLLAALFWTIVGAVVAMLLTLAWTIQKAITQRFARFAEGRPCRTIISPEMLCDVTPEGQTMHR